MKLFPIQHWRYTIRVSSNKNYTKKLVLLQFPGIRHTMSFSAGSCPTSIISDTGRFHVSRHRLFVFNSVGCNMIYNARLRFQTLQFKKVLACVRMSFLRKGDICTRVKKFQYFGELILDFSGKKCIGSILS